MKTRPVTADEQGMALLNVLLIVAVASAAVMVMISTQDIATARSTRFSEAARALSIAHGGELSAITALRRDMLEAPDTDNLSESWAAVRQAETAIDGGAFSLTIDDAQSRFNVNNLAFGGAADESVLRDICVASRAPLPACDRLVLSVRLAAPLSDVEDLAGATGLEPGMMQRLLPLLTALPGRTAVNVNTASEPLLAALLRNPVAARVLVARRSARGFLTDEDLRAANVLLPPGGGFTSSFFHVETTVRIGGTPQRVESIIQRRRNNGVPRVMTVARKRISAAPREAPPT